MAREQQISSTSISSRMAICSKPPFRNLVGHVISIDFHPTKVGLIGSCDSNDEIRLWDINRGDCKLMLKEGSRHVRFQPQLGDFLASSSGNIINIFDVETNSIWKKLQGNEVVITWHP
ncbi:transcriptional corepressor LEUNIG-like isoform X2 [Lycium ferocissimum]|uniref:transcriptional corepressor LEUNIG-like isoform X2 n=1 Tax=Lycium ferocissimum TaxID=112874 RepID=UPI002814D269|nr:transcriptional corepressor LEUNIG-like isoform X2 [Lycium ferocissimum]